MLLQPNKKNQYKESIEQILPSKFPILLDLLCMVSTSGACVCVCVCDIVAGFSQWRD